MGPLLLDGMRNVGWSCSAASVSSQVGTSVNQGQQLLINIYNQHCANLLFGLYRFYELTGGAQASESQGPLLLNDSVIWTCCAAFLSSQVGTGLWGETLAPAE